MTFTRVKLVLSVCLLFGLSGGKAVNTMANEIYAEPQVPVYSLTVTLVGDRRDAFFARMEKFAYGQGFADRIVPTTPDGGFLITMWREDFKIYATNSFDPAVFRFFIYKNDGRKVPPADFEFLLGELRKAIGAIADAEITAEEKRLR